ncbi:MAG: response regulator, partial [Gammaproteobacteria bacterium]
RATLRKGERSILVVEDDSRFADIVCDAVRRRGYKCIVAADGTSGLQLARRFRPSGIILDLGLPDLDGRRVLDVLKRSPATRHIPVHVVSVEDASQEILEHGAIGFLHKPVERADLQQVIDRLEATLTRGPRTVLVVENDAGSQAAIDALLKNENTRIEMATTAAEALAALARGPVDCIVLDLTLPDGDGIELLERLRSDGSEHPPVVVYTGRELGVAEHRRLSELAQSVVLKGATSSDRLLDEVLLFLHAVEEELPEAQKQAVARARGGAEALAGRKVLLVDDDLRNLFALSRLLRSHGLDVVGADNGQMALEQLERNPDVAAVLMDVMMPVMDGLEATRRIRAQPQFHKLPVITITARAMAEDRRRCMEAGASDYISKPVDVDTLVAMLKIWIGSTA